MIQITIAVVLVGLYFTNEITTIITFFLLSLSRIFMLYNFISFCLLNTSFKINTDKN
ncbi:DUF2892 domain-containing protein [Flavobacterium sp. 7A]|uniref:DUF2892 domain-containing protein n=1 Tax=Flavobacterium sp. 7A TaxID=2940571 RepID=UPI0039B6281E